jgi:hypothetical protein
LKTIKKEITKLETKINNKLNTMETGYLDEK